MAISYQYRSDTRIVETRAVGIVTTNDLLDHIAAVLADDRIATGFVEVADYALVEDLVITYSALLPFPDRWDRYRKKGCRAVVIFAPTDLGYGMFRMIKTVVALTYEDAEDLIKIARTEAELKSRLAELGT